MRVASTKLPNPEWEELQNKCNQQGLSIAEHLRNLVHSDLAAENPAQSGEASVPRSHDSSNNRVITLKLPEGKSYGDGPKLDSPPTPEISEMKDLLRKQAPLIQNLSQQVKDITTQLGEQLRISRETVREPRTSGKMDSVFSAERSRLACCNTGTQRRFHCY